MQFEHLILSKLQGARTVSAWSASLQSEVASVTGDDAAMSVMGVGAAPRATPGRRRGPALKGISGHSPSERPSNQISGSKWFANSSAWSSRWNTEVTIANSVPAGAVPAAHSVGATLSRSTTSVVGHRRRDSYTAAPAWASSGDSCGCWASWTMGSAYSGRAASNANNRQRAIPAASKANSQCGT